MLYPHGEPSRDEAEELLRFAIEGRKRIKDQLMRIDMTYASVRFAYRDGSGAETFVRTLEEETYPQYFAGGAGHDAAVQPALPLEEAPAGRADAPPADSLQEKHSALSRTSVAFRSTRCSGPTSKARRASW